MAIIYMFLNVLVVQKQHKPHATRAFIFTATNFSLPSFSLSDLSISFKYNLTLNVKNISIQSIMGNIKSFCCRDNGSEVDDREERSRILGDNCASSNDLYNNSSNSAQDTISYGSINNGNSSKTMEQSALDKIYQKMAANVIDVAPGESMVIQPAEFIERQKAYQAKLNQIKTPLPLRLNNRITKHVNSPLDPRINAPPSPMGVNLTVGPNTSTTSNLHPNNHLPGGNSVVSIANSNSSPQHVSKSQEKRRVEYEPISVDDIQLINEISERSLQAVKSLKIDSREQVVTNFQP